MVSKNTVTLGGKETTRKLVDLTIMMTVNGVAGSIEESGSARIRFGSFCHYDVLGRFTSSAISGFFIVGRNGLLL